MIDDIVINFLSSEIFARIVDIERKCNPLVDLLKFTFNNNILSEIVAINYNLLCSKIFSIFKGQSLAIKLIVAQGYNFH